MPGVKLTVALLHRIVTGAWPRFGTEQWYVMAAAITISMWVQAGEEIGWRGFAQPRLAEHFGLVGSSLILGLIWSSLILGLIWATWHLPLFFVRGGDTYLQSFPLYVLQVTAVSVALAWLYWRTRGSLLLVMLLHAAINNTKDIVPSAVSSASNPFTLSTSLTAWLTVLLLWIAAAFFLLQMRGVKTIREPGEQRNE